MIFNISHGVGKFATITVTAMANTTVTCVQSPYAYSKSTGSGTSVSFVVPKSGTWSITATYGSITKSSTVSVTSYQGNYPVTFTFEQWIFKTGEGAKMNISLGHATNATAEMNTTRIYLRGCADEYNNGFAQAISAALDLSLYKTLYLETTTQGRSLLIRTDNISGTTIGYVSTGARKTDSFDISSITGNHGIFLWTKHSIGESYIYNWWLSA